MWCDVAEIRVEFIWFDIPDCQAANARRIRQIAAEIELDEFAVTGRVNSLGSRLTDVLDGATKPRLDAVE